MSAVHPKVIVALGATAARTIFGAGFALLKNRGKIFDHEWAKAAVATIHPSAILRMPDAERRHEELASFVKDLRTIARLLERSDTLRA